MDNVTLPASEEYDFSDAKREPQNVTAQITAFDVEEKENGTQHIVTFGKITPDGAEDALPFEVKLRAWARHNNEQAQSIGRGQLRKLARAATGSDGYSASTLQDASVKGRLVEDKDGFLKITGFRPAVSEI